MLILRGVVLALENLRGNARPLRLGKAASVGLDADYLNTYTASLSYTNFFDGKYNTQGDRDFLALSFGVNF